MKCLPPSWENKAVWSCVCFHFESITGLYVCESRYIMEQTVGMSPKRGIYTIHFLFGEISDTETHITSVHLTHTHTLPLFAFTHCSQVFNEKIYPGWLRFRYVKIHAAGSFMDFNSLFSARVFTRYFPATRWSPAFSTFKKLGALTAWA